MLSDLLRKESNQIRLILNAAVSLVCCYMFCRTHNSRSLYSKCQTFWCGALRKDIKIPFLLLLVPLYVLFLKSEKRTFGNIRFIKTGKISRVVEYYGDQKKISFG